MPNDDIWLKVPGGYCPLLRSPSRKTAPTLVMVIDGVAFDRLLSLAEMAVVQLHLTRVHLGTVPDEEEA